MGEPERTTSSAKDERAVRALLARLFAAWAAGEGEAYAACFTENSDYVAFNGMHLRGRAANADLHSALFRGPLKGTKLSAEIESVDLLSPDVALALAAGRGRKRSRQTYVVVKSGAGWLIRSFQNTRVGPLSVWVTRWLQKRTATRAGA
jgi:uncharacterized protein (TIGR02246 family)